MNTLKILSKIEKLIDQIPYETASVDIKTSNDTYTLNKNKKVSCGFLGGNEK